MKSKILYHVNLNEKNHQRTGATSHVKNGISIIDLPLFLQIESNPMVEGEYYLIHYANETDELCDTLHDSIEEAMEQAEFECNVQKKEWVKIV